ncbi:unnamed protein product [Acanthoscelides obtectus]|uniref:Uncharacterized protein n=1 Tax=Acanthoscelides obtectus TaxID=200917 RepID=A0A9P0NZV4_ACAOB|nr:unnamed protein product [Acanthoscelides obtectus]CAK1663930.1 hypothetical protein AOBTE_LOCUS23936 [Acanthoscelides obtectus]
MMILNTFIEAKGDSEEDNLKENDSDGESPRKRAPLQKTFSTKFKEAEKKKNIVQNCVAKWLKWLSESTEYAKSPSIPLCIKRFITNLSSTINVVSESS